MVGRVNLGNRLVSFDANDCSSSSSSNRGCRGRTAMGFGRDCLDAESVKMFSRRLGWIMSEMAGWRGERALGSGRDAPPFVCIIVRPD